MKFNLKNRPKYHMVGHYHEYPHGGLYEEWFEGFEKELRERLEDGEFQQEYITEDVVREILGE